MGVYTSQHLGQYNFTMDIPGTSDKPTQKKKRYKYIIWYSMAQQKNNWQIAYPGARQAVLDRMLWGSSENLHSHTSLSAGKNNIATSVIF